MKRTGAVGALLDIYEQAFTGLKEVVKELPDNALTLIRDPHTTDENCRSIQTILSHVVNSAFGYATSIHNLNGSQLLRPDKVIHASVGPYLQDLDAAFAFTENVFKDLNDSDLEQFDDSLKMKTRWGQIYDIEQLTEHAIVHVLRHKRQIINFLK